MGEAAINMTGLRLPPIFEAIDVGIASLQRLSSLQIDTAVFMHGKIMNGAASKVFSEKWGQ